MNEQWILFGELPAAELMARKQLYFAARSFRKVCDPVFLWDLACRPPQAGEPTPEYHGEHLQLGRPVEVVEEARRGWRTLPRAPRGQQLSQHVEHVFFVASVLWFPEDSGPLAVFWVFCRSRRGLPRYSSLWRTPPRDHGFHDGPGTISRGLCALRSRCLTSDFRRLEVHVSRNPTSAGARKSGRITGTSAFGLGNCPVKAGREGETLSGKWRLLFGEVKNSLGVPWFVETPSQVAKSR